MKQSVLSSSKKLILFIGFFIPSLVLGQENTSTSQLKVGISYRSKVKGFYEVGGTIQYNRSLHNSRWKLSANYHLKRGRGAVGIINNGQIASFQWHIEQHQTISELIEYTLIKSKKDPSRGLSIGMGIGYSYSNQDDRYVLYKGFGIAYKISYQYATNSKWYVGTEFFGNIYQDQVEPRYPSGKRNMKMFVMFPTITVGYRLH